MIEPTDTTVVAPVLPKHYDALADLWVASWSEEMPTLDFGARRAWLIEHFAALTAGGTRLRGAFSGDGAPLGFISIDPNTGYIDQVAVAGASKGRGIAAMLLKEARRLSPNTLTLDVNEANPRARRFYEKQGFVEIGTGTSPRTGLPVLKLRWTSVSRQQAAQQQ